MRTYNLRNNTRRLSSNRRNEERRKVNHSFGSTEWLENIHTYYLAWPKHDRRQAERRSDDRRATERRNNQQTIITQATKPPEYQSILTAEERRFIEELYLNDDASEIL